MRVWQGICLSAVLLASLAGACRAQNLPEQEYKKLIRVSEDVQPLGENPFGEQVSLYDGSLSFTQTDISLTGTGPVLQLTRSLHSITDESPPSESNDGSFADWNIEIPRITTTAAILNQGWTIGISHSTARCTQFSIPWTVPARNGGSDWEPHSWWSGYQMIVPGSGSQDLLKRDATHNTLTPQMGVATFNIVTTHNWMLTCGVATDDGTGGEGFLAVAPDGTKYTFNHLIYRWAPNITRSLGSSPAQRIGVQPMLLPTDFLQREQGVMLVTRVEDRFGNYLTYNYDAANPKRLNSIVASDGRQIGFTYDPVNGTNVRIKTASVTSGSLSRTWTYGYVSSTGFYWLTSVTLPDNSSWSFDGGLSYTGMSTEIPGTCDQPTAYDNRSWATTMVHPSGLTGSFATKPAIRGRSYVYRDCVTTSPTSSYSTYPRFYYVPSIVSKTFTGAGLPTRTWAYTFSPASPSWTTDACATSQTCVDTVWADVLDPDGYDVRYTFSNRYDASESHLLRTDFYSGAFGTTLKRSETSGYAAPTSGPFPSVYGDNFQSRINQAQVVTVSPQNLRTITQDGDTYTWQAEAFDVYAQVTQTKRFNSIAGQSAIEEQTGYLNDLPHWVLGLPLQVDNLTTGETESVNTYDLSNVTLQSRAHFGQTLMYYAFNSAGQLASFTDGNSHTTALSNYKRGIPQTIGYPDGTGESLTVDDFGQISAITDQAGHTTSYGYDGVGRISGITYPSGDEVAWLPRTFAYNFVTSAERGIAANHWRRTTTTGSAVGVTYFDAMLRPVLSDSDIGANVQSSTLATYDAKGQKVFGSYPSTIALTFTQTPAAAGIPGSTTTYDALGRATQVQQDSELGPLTSTTDYLSGARQQVSDPKGKVTTTSYQVFDSPSYDAVINVQAPAGITQTIVRDVYGNPLSITQWGLYGTETNSVTKTLIYDNHKRLCRTSEPESGSTAMGYDGANNLAWSVAGAAPSDDGDCHLELAQSASVTTRTYDAMNRVSTILPPVGTGTQSTQYHYTSLGQPDHVVSGISTWDGAYNYRGMLTGESLQVVSQNPWGIGYAHDAYGSLSLIHYPDGENVSYAPDALGRPTQVGSYANGIAYYSNGQVKQFVYGNGVGYVADQSCSSSKNCRQLLRNFSYGPGTSQLSEDLDYDANGNITDVTDVTDGANGLRTKVFSYDDLNRLSTATATGLWGSETYTYDALNNLRSRTSGGQTYTYNYDPSNKLANITNGANTVDSFLYDTRGNVTGKNTAVLAFDQKNQLTQIQGYGDYAYDAAGRRVMKTPTGGTPVYYFYSQAGQLLYQVDAATLKSTNLIYLGTKLVARDESAAPSINTPTYSGTGSYTVSWNGMGGATSYVLQEQVNGASWTTIQTAGTTSIAISGKGEGIYGYKVQACNGVTCGSWSSIASTTVLFPPLTPASITVPATSSGSVAVSWAASSSATSYTLQQQLGGNSWNTVYTGAATSSTSSVPTSGNYTYQVAACNPGGCSAYKVSSAVTVTLPPAGIPTLSVPATNSSGSYTVSWSGVTAATGYTLQEQVNGGGWTTIQTNSATSYAISGKTNGSFGYQVMGCNAGGCGPWSSIGAVAVVLIPAAPTSIVITTSGPSWKPVFTLTWSAMPWATSYQVEETNANGDVTPFYSGPNTTASQLILDEGTVKFRAKSCSTSGCSAWSGYVSQGGATTPPPGTAPTLSVPATSTTGNYTVSWSGVSGAISYTLQERVNNGAWGTVQSGAATSLAISGKSSASYGYQVQACNSSGCGPWSTTQTIAVGVIPAVPAAPQISTSGPYYKPVVHASWAAVASAGSYTLEETDPDGSVSNMYVGPNTTASALILQTGTVKFRVKACSSAGCSAWSGYSSVNLISGN